MEYSESDLKTSVFSNNHKKLSIILLCLLVILLILVIIVVVFHYGNKNNYKIVIDHDGGRDDLIAIAMAIISKNHFGSPQVIALTTVYGEVEETEAFTQSQIILQKLNRLDTLIYRGTDSFLLGASPQKSKKDSETDAFKPIQAQELHAAFGLVQLAEMFQDKLILVALGPLTNVALAIRLDPMFLTRIHRLYILDHVGEKSFFSHEDKTFDLESFYVVMENAIANKVILLPRHTVTSLHVPPELHETVNMMDRDLDLKQKSNEAFARDITNWKSAILMTEVLRNSLVSETIEEYRKISICGIDENIDDSGLKYITKNVTIISAMNEDAFVKSCIEILKHR